MKINTLPKTMWNKVGQDEPPQVRRDWTLSVVCGRANNNINLRLAGCGAEVTIGRKDYYKKQEGIVVQTSYWWRCPCCYEENPIPLTAVEFNTPAPTKTKYLERLRDSVVAELLITEEFRNGINYEPAGLFIRSLDIDVDDCMIPEFARSVGDC